MVTIIHSASRFSVVGTIHCSSNYKLIWQGQFAHWKKKKRKKQPRITWDNTTNFERELISLITPPTVKSQFLFCVKIKSQQSYTLSPGKYRVDVKMCLHNKLLYENIVCLKLHIESISSGHSVVEYLTPTTH